MITRLKLSTIEQGLPKYRSMLAGNAAYVPSSYESIASATGTGSSGTITFSSIPSTYQHLQIRGIADSSGAGTQQDLLIRINGVTSSSYSDHSLKGNGSSVSATGNASQTYAYNFDVVTGNSVTANTLGVFILDLHDYASTSKTKTLRLLGGFDNNGSGYIVLNSNLFNSTSAISSISLIAGGGGFWETNTQIALYGIKGA
jgi:hypothetical protein